MKKNNNNSRKRINKREQDKINKGIPLTHPYQKKLLKVLTEVANEVYGGWSISVPKPSFLAMVCDQEFGSWFMHTLDELERKQKIFKTWKDGEFIVDIIPF
ncbi:MAG: hypothetical protein NC218_08305 [Acetobacter sp.]|nr:hypothetical protein [Acetobacter sp.]